MRVKVLHHFSFCRTENEKQYCAQTRSNIPERSVSLSLAKFLTIYLWFFRCFFCGFLVSPLFRVVSNSFFAEKGVLWAHRLRHTRRAGELLEGKMGCKTVIFFITIDRWLFVCVCLNSRGPFNQVRIRARKWAQSAEYRKYHYPEFWFSLEVLRPLLIDYRKLVPWFGPGPLDFGR